MSDRVDLTNVVRAIDGGLVISPAFIARWIAETEALRAQVEALTKERDEASSHADALAEKVNVLTNYQTCACSYDNVGDVCAHHSPKLLAVDALLRDIIEANDEFRSSMPPDTEKDLVTLACERARGSLLSL